MEHLLYAVRKFLPRRIFTAIQPYYHYVMAYVAAVRFRHPSRRLILIGVTGTKGKSSTTEIIARILEADGKKVASLSTIQFKIGDTIERNLFKMTMPGRFFVQHFLARAVAAGCTHAVVEMTSEGAKQYRHRFLDIDALVFTNLSPEHIESHGSFENYKNAKLSIAARVATGSKRPRYIVANVDDEHGADFLKFPIEHPLSYSLRDLSLYTLHKDGSSLVIGNTTLRVPLIGLFNVYNVLAAITLTRALGVSLSIIERALHDTPPIAGRVEQFSTTTREGKRVTAVVDYAHTPDSLEKLYQAFKDSPKVCVLGNTGGGRDTWKRPEMGGIADRYCERIILTNEDPYDEDPRKIVNDMEKGILNKQKLEIIMDRRAAIRSALEACADGGHVLISGKGTDPYIMGPDNTKEPWSDAEVVQQELARL
ncbi:UDP-N-acetylmuramoyl-L-alanyl-D-glutamate--2,6-diaminopimelate ligase [Patescibacteria group bacterium]|nr:UDP-N-acetylmuramoyl-L-alanyl-D-glutamate--2,6-diaminopimelate ligase [Patescibacteria group bacterium]